MTAPAAVSGDPGLPPSAYERMALVLRAGPFASLALLIRPLTAYLLLHPSATSAQAIESNPILPFLGLPGLAAGLSSGDPAA